MAGSDPAYLAVTCAQIRRDLGSMEGYSERIPGVSAHDREHLRRHYLVRR